MSQIYEYRFVVEGNFVDGGHFSEEGRGVLKMNAASPTDVLLLCEMTKEALETFVAVTQPAKKYSDIGNLRVSVLDVKKRT